MNIFYLNRKPDIAAQMMCDKHVVKMILESAQMLSTAHRVLDGDEYADRVGLYKMTHKNHPSSIWARSTDVNYDWLWAHMDALMKEYTYRYGKHHATERLHGPLYRAPDHILEMPMGFTDPPQCMPDYCKNEDAVSAYQTYYILKKSDFATWKRRDKPEWFYEREKECA
jgi:hypothetical protein